VPGWYLYSVFAFALRVVGKGGPLIFHTSIFYLIGCNMSKGTPQRGYQVAEQESDYSQCWASSLGDCEGLISHEHLISKCLFPDGDINVRGFAWCKDVHKPIRIETLTGKILCEKHNGCLSEVDAAAKVSLESMMKAFAIFKVRDGLKVRRWTIKHFVVDMLLLERWCLKTLINLNHQHGWLIGTNPSEPHIPTKELVEVAFGRRRFTHSEGLYMVAKTGERITLNEGALSIGTTTDGDKLVAGRFTLWGVPFVLSILPEPINATNGATLMRRNMKHGFQTHDDKGRLVTSHFVTFTYPLD